MDVIEKSRELTFIREIINEFRLICDMFFNVVFPVINLGFLTDDQIGSVPE